MQNRKESITEHEPDQRHIYPLQALCGFNPNFIVARGRRHRFITYAPEWSESRAIYSTETNCPDCQFRKASHADDQT